jgi:regulator of sirC expression with transglutaminase-like and TPR domain
MTTLDRFTTLVHSGQTGALPLLEAAAALPQYADHDFTPDDVVREVQRWAGQLRDRIAADASSFARLRLLNHYFYEELGFRGAGDDYYAVENSYLHRVIARRRGIPITLAVLYLELGRAIGLKLAGVGFPGHFLVKLMVHDGALFIDVFNGGATLSADALRQPLARVIDGTPEYPLEFYLRAATDREIVARMLRNLHAIHAEAQDWSATLEVLNRLVSIDPEAAQPLRDRAAAYERLECARAAADDLAAYLALAPNAADLAQARSDLARLQRQAARLN